MAPVSRTTAIPHDIINCKDCLRVRLAQIKSNSNNKAGDFGNDENDNQINIQSASKYWIVYIYQSNWIDSRFIEMHHRWRLYLSKDLFKPLSILGMHQNSSKTIERLNEFQINYKDISSLNSNEFLRKLKRLSKQIVNTDIVQHFDEM